MATVFERPKFLTDTPFHYCPGCHHGIIHKLVAESLVELGLLDDAGFARRRAAELLRKRKSRREILQDLAAKGVDRETAAAAVEALRPEDAAEAGEDPDLASARALIARQYARKLAEGKTQQVMAALARRGFSHSVIKAAVGEAVEELETGNGE